MIVSRIVGGLGNQLFQYAAGRQLAASVGVDFYYDVTPFDTYDLHACALHRLRIASKPMDRALQPRLPSRFGGSNWHRFWRRGGTPLKLVREKSLAWQRDIQQTEDHSYLVGYWQSEKYFSEIRESLLSEFVLATPPEGRDAEILHQMATSTAVMLHVRRGDYVSNNATNLVHGTCGIDYYRRAVAELAEEHGDLNLFVFSDDPGWCRENLSLGHRTTVVDHNDASRNCEDLRLMSHAKHFVIANSSFSWWGAWLSTSPCKTVYAPKRWFRTDDRDEMDIVPDSWRRI